MSRTITAPPPAKQARPCRGRAGRGLTWGLVALLGVCIGALGRPAAGAAAELEPGTASAWSSSGHAAARLVAGAPEGVSAPAALEVRLDPGFITYWRNPGEAGLPPTIDTAASTNVASVAVDFPTPHRLDEGGSVAFGYTGLVALPLRVTLADPTRPASLAADVDYAVCSTICLPAKAHLRLDLPRSSTPLAAARLAAARADVPHPQPLGATGPLAVEAVTATGPGTLAVRARAGAGAHLFVEPPEGWYLTAGAATPSGDGRVTIPVEVVQRPDGAALGGLPLRLTLADASGAIDTVAALRMDETGAKP